MINALILKLINKTCEKVFDEYPCLGYLYMADSAFVLRVPLCCGVRQVFYVICCGLLHVAVRGLKINEKIIL